MPRPIEALIHVDAVRQNLATEAGKTYLLRANVSANSHVVRFLVDGVQASDFPTAAGEAAFSFVAVGASTQLADVFGPGMYQLETNNMPIMTTLQHWDHGFDSPFKSEIYFVNTTRFNDLKWGTQNPIMCRDPEFGPVRIRAFGTYSMRVTDPGKFMTEIVGTDGEFTADEISFQIRNVIVQEASQILAKSGIPVLDMAASNTRPVDVACAGNRAPRCRPYAMSRCPPSDTLRATITTWSPSSTAAEKDSRVNAASRLSVGCNNLGSRAEAR